MSMYIHSKKLGLLKNMVNHNKLCGILSPESVRIEVLPDLVFAVEFFDVEIVYTQVHYLVILESQIVRVARIF